MGRKHVEVRAGHPPRRGTPGPDFAARPAMPTRRRKRRPNDPATLAPSRKSSHELAVAPLGVKQSRSGWHTTITPRPAFVLGHAPRRGRRPSCSAASYRVCGSGPVSVPACCRRAASLRKQVRRLCRATNSATDEDPAAPCFRQLGGLASRPLSGSIGSPPAEPIVRLARLWRVRGGPHNCRVTNTTTGFDYMSHT